MLNLLTNYKSIVDQVLKTKNNINTESQDWSLPLWIRWYAGIDESFHRYYIYNGVQKNYKNKKHLNLAKRVCEDWASLLMSDKVEVHIGDSEVFDSLAKKVQLKRKFNRAIEVGFALSYAGVVVDLKNLTYDKETGSITPSDKTEVILNYYRANQTIPITFENSEITECAFVSETSKMLSINAHIMDKETGEYHILIYRKNKETQQENKADFNTKSKEPLFAIVEPNIENNLICNSPYPISIFANAISTLQECDEAFDTSNLEFVNGKKRIFVSSAMTTIVPVRDNNGEIINETINAFDNNDASIYIVPQSEDEKNLIYSPNDPLRCESINVGLQAAINLLSYEVGLGTNYYRFDKGGEMTATQVISENSDAYKNKKKHEQIIEDAIVRIANALRYCNNNFTTNEKIDESAEPIVLFDDGIIEDKKSERECDRIEVEKNIQSKVEYRMKWYGEDEETATSNIYHINGRVDLLTRAKSVAESFMSNGLPPKAFVRLVFTKDDLAFLGMTEEEMIAYYEGEAKETEAITPEDLVNLGGYQPPKNDEEEQAEIIEEQTEEEIKEPAKEELTNEE